MRESDDTIRQSGATIGKSGETVLDLGITVRTFLACCLFSKEITENTFLARIVNIKSGFLNLVH